MSTALARYERLEVLREVASGPSGTVFAAERIDSRSDRHLVALKVVQPGPSRPGEDSAPALERAIERLQGALLTQQQLARLHQRHLVCASGIAVVKGRPALVRPWVEGVDLLDWVEILRETGIDLPARVVCEVLRSVAVALDAALNRAPWGQSDAIGVIHRDLKPSNILIGRDGDVRVLDFACGYSVIADDDVHTGALRAGIIKYMAPERRTGDVPTASADVYSLGILAIELFRGRWLRRLRGVNPAHDRHLAEVVASMDPPDMRSEADDRALRSLLLRMVSYDPLDRPTAVEVAHTLRSLSDRAPGASLETFAHDHALPYLEPPSPRIDDPPVATLGLEALSQPSPARQGHGPSKEAATPRPKLTPPFVDEGPTKPPIVEPIVQPKVVPPVVVPPVVIPPPRSPVGGWLVAGGLLVLVAGTLIGAGTSALIVLLTRL